MDRYTIYCTETQTKKALELGASIKTRNYRFDDHSKDFFAENGKGYFIPTAEQMIGFILESGRGYSYDLSQLIREQGYKQGCLTFIENNLK